MKMKRTMLFTGILCAVVRNVSFAAPALEPFVYREDFETRSLRAWASYPLWQDTAYDPNFRVNEMVPGDPNISIVQKVTPYTHVDNYAGAEKLFDIWLVPGSMVTLRYYIKSHLPVEFFKVRLAAGPDGTVDFTIPDPPLNRWERITVGFPDFVRENPCLAGKDRIKVNALAVLAKVPLADPDMPFYLGLDDITVRAAREMEFQFAEPEVYKLSEFKPYIARTHYSRNGTFRLKGAWPGETDAMKLTIVSFADRTKTFLSENLKKSGGSWEMTPLKLTFPAGLYLAVLTAYRDGEQVSETRLSFYIAPDGIGGRHPRILFESAGKKRIEERLKSERFKEVYEAMATSAKSWRDRLPVEKVEYVADQFPDEDWLPTLGAWVNRTVGSWRDAAQTNALAYAFHNDREAGEYVVKLLLKIAPFPDWNHPWLARRGRYQYHPTGVMSDNFGLAYDLTYDLMSPEESRIIRTAFVDKLIKGAFRTYVEDDMVTCDTSNWISHVVGGPLTLAAAIYGDGDELTEPYFSGCIFKLYDFIERVHGSDGSYGEGFGYNSYTLLTLSRTLASLENALKIDLSAPLDGSYQETIWTSIIEEKKHFHFGDSGGNLNSLDRWAWLLGKYRDPLLGWFYRTIQGDRMTFDDALYDTETVPREDPYDEKPVRVFRSTGTTVFKSGWKPGDFIFVMRTGPFFNHQHLDQGTFWLWYNATGFIEERHGSTYYDDPLYQSWYTQPVGHSTVLIDGNHQSQRVGDHFVFAGGFDDYAFVGHFLDGTDVSFVSGDIGRLYWGKVESLVRNVLYLKPRTVLMLDTVVPAERDADVTVLYQTERLGDITAGSDISAITKDGGSLYIRHLSPERRTVTAVETPHYLYTLRDTGELEKEGMLTVTARTCGVPLVIGNLLTATAGETPVIDIRTGDGFVSGTAEGIPFVYSTRPGSVYTTGGLATDALAVTESGGRIFAALCTTISRDGKLLIKSEEPLTCEISGTSVRYFMSSESSVSIGAQSRPTRVTVNGASAATFGYDTMMKAVVLTLPAGEGIVSF